MQCASVLRVTTAKLLVQGCHIAKCAELVSAMNCEVQHRFDTIAPKIGSPPPIITARACAGIRPLNRYCCLPPALGFQP